METFKAFIGKTCPADIMHVFVAHKMLLIKGYANALVLFKFPFGIQ